MRRSACLVLLLVPGSASAGWLSAYSQDFQSWSWASTEPDASGQGAWTHGWSGDRWAVADYQGDHYLHARTDSGSSTAGWGVDAAQDNHLTYTGAAFGNLRYTVPFGYYGNDGDVDDTMGAVFRYVDSANFYLVTATMGGAIPAANGVSASAGSSILRLYRIQGGNGTIVAQASAALRASDWSVLQITAIGDRIQVAHDENRDGSFSAGETLIDVTDASSIDSGRIGLYCFDHGSGWGCAYNNLVVERHDADNDNVPDDSDNCMSAANASQADLDKDGMGDACDTDADGDGATIATDCDDLNAAIKPGVVEVCDGVDADCDGASDDTDATDTKTWYLDKDGDGYPGSTTGKACSAPTGSGISPNDCDDSDAGDHPGASETCNGDDEDCDGIADDGVLLTFYADRDGDGYGVGVVQACTKPGGASNVAGDCDDADATAYPGASEVCDGVDDDCDSLIDDGVLVSWYTDADRDGWGAALASGCAAPSASSSKPGDCDDADLTEYPGALEVCDGADDDCDGQIDEDVVGVWYHDGDGDGYGASTVSGCAQPTDASTQGGDCDDADKAEYPGAPELCDGADDDCDGSIDESATNATTWYLDQDTDGYGVTGSTKVGCAATGAYTATKGGDCGDSNSAIRPGVSETCDGVDQDCDGSIDEGLPTATYWDDLDGDTYGDDATPPTESCAPVPGAVTRDGDCDDGVDAVHPGVPETCDGVDQDCDGKIDEFLRQDDFWPDADADGFGDESADPTSACLAPDGMVDNGRDCDDDDEGVNPDATEISGDGVDQDCDGEDPGGPIDTGDPVDTGNPVDTGDPMDTGDPVDTGGDTAFDTDPTDTAAPDGVDRPGASDEPGDTALNGVSGEACGCQTSGSPAWGLVWIVAALARRRR